MSKVPMKHIFIAGLKTDRKHVLEMLQRAGVVQIESGGIEHEGLMTMNVMGDKALFDRSSNQAGQALEILNKLAPDQEAGLLKSLEGAEVISVDEYTKRLDIISDAMKTADRIIALDKRITEAKAQIPRLQNRIESLKPWMTLDVPLNYEGTEKTAAFIGSIKNAGAPEEILKSLLDDLEETRDEAPAVSMSVVSAAKEQTCLFFVCLREDAYLVENALKKIGFARAGLSGTIPSAEAEKAAGEIKALEAEIVSAEEGIRGFASERKDLEFTADYYQMRADKYDVLSKLPQSDRAFFINGYLPAAYAEGLKKKIEQKFDAEVEITEPAEDENVPVVLRNNPFSDPMETVVESYSLPGSGEIDPSFILSLFYYLFFGLMLSDAGYGLLMVLGCGLALLKVKNMKPGMKKLVKLFFFSGISTVFWGLMFGSFFGDAVKVIAATWFNVPDLRIPGLTVPIWFEPVSEPMRMLVFAFGLGVVHLFTGLGIKGYLCLKAKDFEGFLCDVVFWAMFVGGGIVYLLTMDMVKGMFNLPFELGPAAANAAAIVAGIGAVGVVLTGGRESKNLVKRLLKGAYAAYGVTGWLSDILSYSRLLALGLATGIIAQVFNKMGSMFGATIPGLLIFILVFLIGHVLNLGINVLGAYVHTNRLQFVEFFGKFYEGGGKEYAPFTENTKYYSVKEEK